MCLHSRVRRRHIVDYLSLAVIWGLSFVLLLKVVAAFGWVGAVAFRSLIASGVLLVIAAVSRRRLAFGRWRHLAVVGATTVGVQLIGLNLATPRIGTAMAAIFVGTIPLFSMLIGHVWGIERLTGWGRIGLLLGFAGIIALVGFPAVPVTGSFVFGCGCSVASAVGAAYGSNYARRHLQAVGSWEQTIGAFAVAGVGMLPLLAVVPLPHRPSPVDLAYLGLLAVMCSAVAYVLYFRLVAEVGATIAISVEFLVTVVAVFVGAAVLGEHLAGAQLAGGAVIIVGCALVLGLLPGTAARLGSIERADLDRTVG